MVGAYKLIFDLSVYYSLTGFYMVLFYRESPSALGFLLLCVSIVLERFAHQRGKKAPVLMALPAAALILWPGTEAFIQLIPSWLYVIRCVRSDRLGVTYLHFQERFKFGLMLMLAMLPGLFIGQDFGAAFSASVPYITLLLASGVCLLRLLREESAGGIKQLLPLLAVIGVCAALTAAGVPRLIGNAFDFLYQNVIRWGLQGLILLICQILNVLYICFRWMMKLFGRDIVNPLKEQTGDTAGEQTQDTPFPTVTETASWVQILFSLVAAALAAWAVITIFRRLSGYQIKTGTQASYTDRRQSISAGAGRRRTVLRPRDPRLAVRFYYAKFLQECQRRGMTLKPGCTSEELAKKSADYFPGEDPARLRELYVSARYCENAAVSAAQAHQAAACWRCLKRTKLPEGEK